MGGDRRGGQRNRQTSPWRSAWSAGRRAAGAGAAPGPLTGHGPGRRRPGPVRLIAGRLEGSCELVGRRLMPRYAEGGQPRPDDVAAARNRRQAPDRPHTRHKPRQATPRRQMARPPARRIGRGLRCPGIRQGRSRGRSAVAVLAVDDAAALDADQPAAVAGHGRYCRRQCRPARASCTAGTPGLRLRHREAHLVEADPRRDR
jgi:hypothetical protein